MKISQFSAFAIALSFITSCSHDDVPRISTDPLQQTISRTVTALGTLQDGGLYRIRALASHPNGPAIEIAGMLTSDGGNVQQWNWFPNAGQRWRVYKKEIEGNIQYYEVVNQNSAKALEVPNASTTTGIQLRQYTRNNSAAQRWRIDYAGNYLWVLANKATGQKMSLNPNNNTNGNQVVQLSTPIGNQEKFVLHNLNFQNPIVSSTAYDCPDPHVAQKDGSYYITWSQFSRIAIRKNNYMSLMGTAGDINVLNGSAYGLKDIWAPELHYLDGAWYLYFTATKTDEYGHRMYYMKSNSADPSVSSGWSAPSLMVNGPDNYSIDGTVFQSSGSTTKWFIWSGRKYAGDYSRLYIKAMSSPTTLTGAEVIISSPTNSWEKDPANGYGVNEGPQILRQTAGGLIFLIFSASATNSDNYCLGQLMLRGGGNPMVPADWINKKQVFAKKPANSVYAPGHNGFFTSGSEFWIIYHARSTSGNGIKNIRMQKFSWNSDGSPNFGTPVPINTDYPVPAGE
jgi:GH43 family beta-xylosidase